MRCILEDITFTIFTLRYYVASLRFTSRARVLGLSCPSRLCVSERLLLPAALNAAILYIGDSPLNYKYASLISFQSVIIVAFVIFKILTEFASSLRRRFAGGSLHLGPCRLDLYYLVLVMYPRLLPVGFRDSSWRISIGRHPLSFSSLSCLHPGLPFLDCFVAVSFFSGLILFFA